MISKWLDRIVEYYQDKRLAKKCGIDVSEVCAHEEDVAHPPMDVLIFKCIKCGRFYYGL